MTAFSTAVLDNFNRANGALGANWSAYKTAQSQPSIVSNQAFSNVFVGTPSAAVWNPATFLQSEVYTTVITMVGGGASVTLLYLLARVQNPNTANPSAYAGVINNNVGLFSLAVGRFDASSAFTNLASIGSGTDFALGDKIGFRCYDYTGPGLPGVMLELWVFTAATGYWKRWVAFNDKTQAITAAGNLGMAALNNTGGNTTVWDDFGGGTIVPGSKTINSTDFPVFSGAIPSPLGDEVKSSISLPWIPQNIAAHQDPLAEPVEKSNTYMTFEDFATYSPGGKIEVL